MAETQTEREDKFDVGLEFALPDLGRKIIGDGRVDELTVGLTSTYYDTADRALLRQNVTLRRREGDTDAGWQMKVPAGPARTEIRLPLHNSNGLPAELADLTLGLALGQALAPVAILKTVRRLHRLIDSNDRQLLEVADDLVHATALGESATIQEWREIEVELGIGSEELLAEVGRRLVEAGARPSGHPSKLARALGEPQGETEGGEPTVADAGQAAISAYLIEQFHVLAAGDLSLRRGLDAVHPTRVATRRLRSTLRVFAAWFDPATQSMDVELSWYAGLLGGVRDPQVQRLRFAEAVAALPDELVLGPIAARIDQHLLSEELHNRELLMDALRTPRYLSLLGNVERSASGAAFNPVAPGGAKIVRRQIARASRQAEGRLEAALAGPEDDELLHTARKAAKRARYATELGAPVIGVKKANRLVARYTRLQDVLGEHQDSVVAAGLLQRLGAQAGTRKGENGFTYGLLYARERDAAARAREMARSIGENAI